ncbi:hypothetical protein MTP99_006169 [Tenebrio molitor]|nr:hypothetical protein MTP99_006169 [Tenebrio molitor]
MSYIAVLLAVRKNGLSDPDFWCRLRQICERKGKRKKGGTDAIFRGARQGSRFTFTTESVCVCLCSKGEIRGCFLSATGVGEPVEEDRSGWKIVQEELQPYAAADLGFLHASADLTSPPYWIPSPRPGSDASSTFFDDDINDKDFKIDSDELVISETDSDTDDYDVAVEKEIDDKELIWVEPEVEKNSNIILQNIQVNKPNVSESEGAKFLSSRIKEAKEVTKILRGPLNSKGRKKAIAALRKETHFENYLGGDTRPACRNLNDDNKSQDQNPLFYPCTRCKGLYKKSYLRRHVKLCTREIHKETVSTARAVSKSQTFTAYELDRTDAVAQLEVKEKVFDMLRGDDIAFAAKKDLLMTYFGNSYLKKHKKEKSVYTCSNKMTEFGRETLELINWINTCTCLTSPILCILLLHIITLEII